jgi:diguanylate cyclase (GGDEF)-like protein
MGRSAVDLAEQLCPDNLQDLQDTLSRCIGLPLLFADAHGRPLAACEDLCEFCRHFTRAIPLTRPCLECGRCAQLREMAELSPWGLRHRSLTQECPLGPCDVVIPIWIAGDIPGYLLTAQVCLKPDAEGDAVRRAGKPQEAEEHLALIGRLRKRSRQEMESAAAGLLAVAALVGSLGAARMRNLRLAEHLREQSRWMEAHEQTDAVTALANRRHFCAALTAEAARARRYKRPFSVALLDVSGFRQVNDHFGHSAGDAVLRAVARCLSSTIRQTDLVGRVGGDEFAILFPETERGGAMIALTRVRAQIADLNASGELPVEVRVAVGIADWSEGHEDLLAAAYQAAQQEQESLALTGA